MQHRPPEQRPWTCRTPAVFSGCDKGDIPPTDRQADMLDYRYTVVKFARSPVCYILKNNKIDQIIQLDYSPVIT